MNLFYYLNKKKLTALTAQPLFLNTVFIKKYFYKDCPKKNCLNNTLLYYLKLL